ncbi:N-acetylmuramoyl-L-alanine amidase [Paenibacillus sp. 598K]|uniref:N-acetylmuramoyl-L-alanine amidase n=1 Tax=Paenibacillus sp. 598K TaxID=1117987 RepID=UPI000FF92F45|nr:N-acetylmuramoyl-L-alanine amidase [Paenibacillus sp. 598K]GBF77212.1 N-acetylmuramoyl-L-alanine amidase [Paenibacillus sp. 598K]
MRVAWKHIGLLAMLACVLALFPTIVQAASEPSIVVDGKKLELSGGASVEIKDGNVIIPIRVVTENLGFRVNWDGATRGIDITDGSRLIRLTIDSKTAYVDGEEKQLLAAPALKKGVTSVPLRFVSEQMGMNVQWHAATKTAIVNRPAPPVVETPSITVDEIRVDGRQLTIAVGGKVEPKVFTMSGPDRIVIDLPGTSLSRTLEERAGQKGVVTTASAPEIANVRYALFSSNPSTVRIVMDLSSATPYQVSRGAGNEVIVELLGGTTPDPATGGETAPGIPGTDGTLPGTDGTIPGTDGSTVTPGNGSETPPVIDPEFPPVSSGKKLIVLDAGHGGKDPGTIGYSKTQEKGFNLSVVLKVQALLQNDPNMEVVLTRDNDTFIELGERGPIANRLGADAFISVHANSVENSPSASGTESYYYEEASKAFTQVMHKHLLKATGFKDRGVKKASFKVLRDTQMISVLLESGFISNPTEEAALFTEEMQQKIAQAIVDALYEYFGFSQP